MDRSETMFEAIRKGDANEVARLLEEDPGLVDAKTSGVSALLTAVYHRRPEIARLLQEKGATLDVFEACAVGDVERLRELLAEDPARANAFAADGFTPLGLASFFGNAEAARLLLASGANANLAARNPMRVAPLHSAIAGKSVQIARELLEHGADVHARQEGGYTPLHGAAVDGDEEAIRLLLGHGANPVARNDAGKTPADLARDRGRPGAVELLS